MNIKLSVKFRSPRTFLKMPAKTCSTPRTTRHFTNMQRTLCKGGRFSCGGVTFFICFIFCEKCAHILCAIYSSKNCFSSSFQKFHIFQGFPAVFPAAYSSRVFFPSFVHLSIPAYFERTFSVWPHNLQPKRHWSQILFCLGTAEFFLDVVFLRFADFLSLLLDIEEMVFRI